MKLSLSVRSSESANDKSKTAIPFEQFAPMARELGFDGICMRASVASITTPAERVAEVKSLLDSLGLGASMVTGDTEIAANTSVRATDHLRNITPYLDLTEKMGARLHRVMMRSPIDIKWVQRAADEAAERGIKLAHQMHWGTLCETVDDALTVVELVNRPRGFGLTYEPANLLLCGDEWGRSAIQRLAPHIVNAYFQNIMLDESSSETWPSFRRGPVRYRYLPFADPRGCDLRVVMETLKEVGYDGWFTVHQPLLPGQTVEEGAREAMTALKQFV